MKRRVVASLDRVRSKIDWAYKHLKALETELVRNFQSKPSQAVGEIEADPNIVVWMRLQTASIPPSVPLLIGDCLQNLRSGLDYLVWELVLAAKNEPNKKNQFPICKTENGFKSELGKGRLDGITAEARTEIEGLQPYLCGDKRSYSLLILDEFCNINRHRRLLLTKAEPIGIFADFSSSFGQTATSFIPVGEQATNIGVSPPMRDGERMYMKGQAVLAVVFDEGTVKGEEVCQCLGRLGFIISEWVTPRFEKFF